MTEVSQSCSSIDKVFLVFMLITPTGWPSIGSKKYSNPGSVGEFRKNVHVKLKTFEKDLEPIAQDEQ